jgi:hypothetical protein
MKIKHIIQMQKLAAEKFHWITSSAVARRFPGW